MGVRPYAAMVLAGLASLIGSGQAIAQGQPMPTGPSGTVTRTLLAVARLPTVIDTPLYYKLLKVELGPEHTSRYVGGHSFVYVLSGKLTVSNDENRAMLDEGSAAYIGANRPTELKVEGTGPATFLYFLLLRPTELTPPTLSASAKVTELYKTPAPIPDLKPGPHEFSMTRVTFPRHFGPNPPHYRSGAALYFISSGAGAITADGKTETRPAGSFQYEPYGFVHQWASTGDTPLVLIQANISQEGVPAVIIGLPPVAR